VFCLIATCEVPEAETYEPDGFIGVDLGIVNIATTSTGYQAAGRGLNRYRKRRLALRVKLQKKRTKSAKRRLKERSRREQRHVKNTNHIIAKTIVTEAERTSAGISLEELKGIRQRVRLRKPGGTSHALKAVGEGRTPLLGLCPARRLRRLQGQAGRRAPGLR
jgi:transposase